MHQIRSAQLVGLVACLAFSTTALAAFEGFYTGYGLGQSKNDYRTANLGLDSSDKITDDGLSHQFNFGYQFTPHCAIEMGYSHYSTTRIVNANSTGHEALLKQYSIDMLGKAMLPLTASLALYTKLGTAWLNSKPDDTLVAQSNQFDGKIKKLHLLWGAGASYDLSDATQLSLNWLRTQKRGMIRNIDTFTLGIGYHFG
jgi:opacity protein-like surface antigen